MIVTFIKRCLLLGTLFSFLSLATLAFCAMLACSQPAFYAAAVADPLDEAETKAAMDELEVIGTSLELFVKSDPQELQQMQRLLEKNPQAFGHDNMNERQQKQMRQLAVAFEGLDRALDEKQQTFTVTLTQRHIDAFLAKQLRTNSKELKRPHLFLAGDMLRFGVTCVTPAAEAVLSCDFKLAMAEGTDLTFELHRVRIGTLPVPATTILRQYMKLNPVLPAGFELDVTGERPTLTFSAWPDHGKLRLDDLQVVDGQVRLNLRRADKVG